MLLIIVSITSNFLSALSGGGAGLIQLPALIFLGLPFSKALATHKVASVALGLGASIRHYKEKTLETKITLFVLGFGLPGVLLGANTIFAIPSEIATFSLGIMTLCLGIYSSKSYQDKLSYSNKSLSNQRLIIGCFILFLIGVLNGSLTSGTGLFVTLWLVKWFGLSYTRAVAYTLILVGIAWNGTGAIVLGLKNEIQWFWLPSLIIGSLTGGYLGAHIGIIKGDKLVKTLFEFISITIGISLIVKSISHIF
ncbi:putative permease [Prochlorococcus sp. SS52]|nr:putative permease [Prochlorococcus marinus str. LG]KGG23793.1 putative permease [Prochlorococcus marinus str. SS35]KGG34476.1 putative permease [Prochlorococcus sp. SS52]